MKNLIFGFMMVSSVSAFASTQMECVGKTNPQLKATVEINIDSTIHTDLLINDGAQVLVDSKNADVKFGDGPVAYRAEGSTLKLIDGTPRNVRDREDEGGGVEMFTYDTTWQLSKGSLKTLMTCSRTTSNQ